MEITTVLSDAGGVILDESEAEHARAEIISANVAALVPGYSVEDYRSDIEEALLSFSPSVYRYVLWKRSDGDTSMFDRLHESYRAEWGRRQPELKLTDGLREELQPMSGRYSIGIAGQYGSRVLDLLRRETLLDHFAHRYTQVDFSITKPDPRYFEQIASACGVEPQQCVMVGDRIDNDVIPAKQVGMRTIRVRAGLHKDQRPRAPDEMPDLELTGVVGLASAVDQLADRR